MSHRRRRWAVSLALSAALAVAAGCGTDTGPSPAAPGSTEAVGTGPSARLAGRDAPPDGLLAAEGGDPVIGQLGTYTWLGSGSDSPWLPGTPMTVGAAEPLAVSFLPDGAVASWRVLQARADAGGPDGAILLAEGVGSPVFAAPGSGRWTVAVEVAFANGVGDAVYAWALTIP